MRKANCCHLAVNCIHRPWPSKYIHIVHISKVLMQKYPKDLIMKIACCLPTYFKPRAAIKIDTKECFSILFCICQHSQKAGLHKSKFTYLPLLYIERCASIYCSMTTIVEHSIAQLTKVYFSRRNYMYKPYLDWVCYEMPRKDKKS